MFQEFKKQEEILQDKVFGSKKQLKTFKLLLASKGKGKNQVENFFLMIYFLFYRISLELGFSMMTMTEASIFFIIYTLLLFSFINQGFRVVFRIGKRIFIFGKELVWVYRNIDYIRTLIKRK